MTLRPARQVPRRFFGRVRQGQWPRERPCLLDRIRFVDSFFRPGDFACAIYCRTRDKMDRHNTKGREFMEAIWQECGGFLDPDTPKRATLSMPAVFWELYLAHVLKSAGISLQPQARSKKNQKGPDLFADKPDVWIEAVLPELGTGPDAMEYPPMGIASDVPVRSFILRLRSAFETKARIMAEYARTGLVKSGQAQVIAISGALLPTAIGEGPVPRILQAILGVGNLVLDIAQRTGEIVGHSVEHRDEVQKKSGAAINTAPFLDHAYSHISAVIYSASCWVNHPPVPGPDFTVIHNDIADVKLPHGWLPIGDEYWREGDKLHSERHSTPVDAGPDTPLEASE